MPDAQNQHSTQDAVDRARRLLAVEDGHLEYDPLVIEDAQALVNLYEQYENLVALRDDLTLKAYERGQEVERLKEQLEAFQELAQDASDITQVGHGLELDVPVNLGSVKLVEAAYHVLLTMASLASNPASTPKESA